MAEITRLTKASKLCVTMKGSGDVSLGTRTISDCAEEATLAGYLKAGNAIMVLCGAIIGDVKKVTTHSLIN